MFHTTLETKLMFAESVHRILGTDTIKKEVPALLEQSSLGQMKGV